MASWFCLSGCRLQRTAWPAWFLAALAYLIPVAAPAQDASFSQITAGPLGEPGNTFGVAWGDYDNDGDEDLYLSNTTTPNKLLRNDGNDVFVDVTTGDLGDSSSNFGVAWADYDNDGDLDLFLCATYANRLLRNDGGGVFSDVANPALRDVNNVTQGVAWGDYDEDGDLDLYITNFDGPNKMFRNEGGGVLILNTPVGLDDATDGSGVAWADYDNDGDLDLYTGAIQGSRLYRNESPGIFNDATNDTLNLPGATGVAWGDYDNDADLDLYVGRSLVDNTILRNEGNNKFIEYFSAPLRDNGDAGSVAWGDFDNDGDLDLFLGNTGSRNELFRNEGFGIFNEVGTLEMDDAGDVKGAAWADYDNDGDLDLYLGIANGANKLFRNDLVSNNHWLHVRLWTTGDNRYAIGGRVRLVAGGVQQIREVEGGSGLFSQNSLCLEFGMGVTPNVALLEVHWPDGQIDSVSVPGVDRKLTVIQQNPSQTGIGDPGPGSGVRLLANHPNPFRGATRIRYELDRIAPVDIRVFDVAGRMVRVLESGSTRTAGSHEVIWDGRDDAGREVVPGVYFYRLHAGDTRAASRMIVSP